MSSPVFSKAYELLQQGIPVSLVTIIKKEGSASRENGRMLVWKDKQCLGTIGGGALEAFAIEQADALQNRKEPRCLVSFSIEQVGTEKAGAVQIFIEQIRKGEDDKLFLLASELEHFHSPFAYISTLEGQSKKRFLLHAESFIYGSPSSALEKSAKKSFYENKGSVVQEGAYTYFVDIPQRRASLLLIGGGHVNQAIASLADTLGIETQVLETREEYTKRELFPNARKLVVAPTLKEGLESVSIEPYTSIVIAAHAFGAEEAEYLFSTQASYIGILASHNKERAFKQRLKLTADDEKRLFSPIGLDLGAQSPEEIAVSVLSEILKVTNKTTGTSLKYKNQNLVIVRGAGDLATGVILRLANAGYQVIALETDKPTVIRCTVSLAQAMFDQTMTVENTTAVRCDAIGQVFAILKEGKIPILADPEGAAIEKLKPICVVDAILAKRNLGTKITDAPLVMGLGPGFTAGKDCHVVIETKRGHSLGRIITEGCAIPDSGIPGIIGGYGAERVIRSPGEGIFHSDKKLGDIVKAGDCIATVDGQTIFATIDGMLRGLLNNGLAVTKGFKVADIDPRGKAAEFTTSSDKAKAIGGGVLEALDHFKNSL
jgi:xanthine dehydrogenase accessory factor